MNPVILKVCEAPDSWPLGPLITSYLTWWRGDHGASRSTVSRIYSRPPAVPAPLGYKGFPKRFAHRSTTWFATAFQAKSAWRTAISSTLTLPSYSMVGTATPAACFSSGMYRSRPGAWSTLPLRAMMRGISVVKPGATLGDIGNAIQNHAEAARCSVVRDFCAWARRVFHDTPNVLHYGEPGTRPVLREGMFSPSSR